MERQNELALTPWLLENVSRLAVKKGLFAGDPRNGMPVCTESKTGRKYQPNILEVLLVDIHKAICEDAHRVDRALLEGEGFPPGLRDLYDKGLYLLEALREVDKIPPVNSTEFQMIRINGGYKNLTSEDILCLFGGRKYGVDYKTQVSMIQ